MNYKDIYNSYMEDIKIIEKKYKLSQIGVANLTEIKEKAKELQKKIEEMEVIEGLEEKLDYYTTVDYTPNFKNLRRKIIHKYGEIANLGQELEKLFYLIEKEKSGI